MKVYGDRISGNCLKVAYTADLLGLDHEWIDVDILKEETRSEAFLAINPAGQVPVVVFDDGRSLTQSNAIIRYLARGSFLLPDDPFTQAKIDEFLFWEQYSHEPYIAVCRFQSVYFGKTREELDPEKIVRGYKALDFMERHLRDALYFVGDGPTIADIALVAYTRLAHEGGFSLDDYRSVQDWIGRIERDLIIDANS